MRVISGIVVTILVAACTASAFSPLQFHREQGFPLHNGKTNAKSSLLKSFTKARLPVTVVPHSYELDISPILDSGVGSHVRWTAPGSVRIIVNATEATSTITLNSVGITINPTITVAPVDTADTTVFVVTGVAEADKEFYHLNLDKSLTAGKQYQVDMQFVAPIETNTTKLSGLYRSSFYDPSEPSPVNRVKYIATTQFEATAARQAFPCFDEPWIKATFAITIGYNGAKHIALSNGDLNITTNFTEMGADWKKNTFNPTVKMSSYLVALIVGDFDYTQAAEEFYSKKVRIYATPIRAGGSEYAANTSAKLLKFFEERYGIDYKLNKMDSVAMPDFEFGAMENYGLNIYREAYLLNYVGVTTESEREQITLILSHELAHQWFGNLVTSEFWSQIWLNEAFATYNENIAAEAIMPEYKSGTTKQNDILQVAMITDGNPDATHPLINSASYDDTNVELMTHFDRITYQKGGSLVLMMEGFLGNETFRKGLVRYLNEKSFQAAHQDDLFAVLTQQAHEDGKLSEGTTVKDIMDTWTLQSGYPLVRVSKADDSRIYLTQERFSNSVKYTENSGLDPNELWTIPVAVATSAAPEFNNHEPALWINKNVLLKSAAYDATKWLVVNAGATGYYRVLYDSSLTALLVNQLVADQSVISPVSRSQLIDDYFTLAAHKFTDIENALSFTKYLRKETELVVWNTVFTHLRSIFNKLTLTGNAFTAFKGYWIPRLEAVLAVVGLEQPGSDIGAPVILRAQLLDWACALEHAACRVYASRLFDEWNASTPPPTNPVPIDIQPIVYCAAVASGDPAFIQAQARYSNSTTLAKDKGLLLNALACSSVLTRLLALLGQVTEPTFITAPAERITLLQKLVANPLSRTSAITFIKTNAGEIIDKLNKKAITDVFGTISAYAGTTAELEDIKAIITSTAGRFTEAELAVLNNYAAVIEANIVWRTENEERLATWFSDNIA